MTIQVACGHLATLTTWGKKSNKWQCYNEFSGELFSVLKHLF